MPRELDLLTIITILPPKRYVTVRVEWAGSLGLGVSDAPVHAGCVEQMHKPFFANRRSYFERTWWQRILDWLAGSGHCYHCHGPRNQDQWS